jgi:deoxycytidine triphosphate deaminase
LALSADWCLLLYNVRALQRLLQDGSLGWDGSLRGDALLVRLGAPLQPFGVDETVLVDLKNQASIERLYGPPVVTWTTYELPPGQVILCLSLERIRLHSSLSGRISTLSHLARVGLMSNLASWAVMPGFDGHLTLELFNAGPARLLLHHGMAAAKVLIEQVVGSSSFEAASTPYYGCAGRLRSRYAEEFGSDR